MSSETQSWLQVATTMARLGEISIRIGILIGIVYGIFWALKLFTEYLHGLPFFSRQFLELSLFSILSFAGAALCSVLNEHYSNEGNYRMAGLFALITASILLIPAPVAGLLMLLGGIALYISAEIKNVLKMRVQS
uniref:DUF4064 domain-containing protein n=1 Tax=Thermofilum adornatum TaxID=1365176 RepID=A0A7C1GAC9_9CREN